MDPCPQCGGEFPPGETCRDRYEACLAFEYEHPESFGAVHHLTVTCYMLQHNGYSDRGWLEARALLAGFVRGGVTPGRVRAARRKAVDGRGWKLTRGPRLPGVEAVRWSFSLARVRLSDPETYVEDVKRWAECVLANTEELVREQSK